MGNHGRQPMGNHGRQPMEMMIVKTKVDELQLSNISAVKPQLCNEVRGCGTMHNQVISRLWNHNH